MAEPSSQVTDPNAERGEDRRSEDARRQGERRGRIELGPPVVEFRNIWKAFDGNSIYEGLDLTIHQGETLTIVGGSGTGKSVCVKAISKWN